MDFGSLLGYLETLAMLYAWIFVAAGAFALGEMVLRKQRPAPENSTKHPAS